MATSNVPFSNLVASERQPWLNYRTVWRWHFYAGLFSIPFVIWLSITGSIYLFRPQIEHWLDKPYDSLTFHGPLKTPAAQTEAALAVVPGSNLHYYQLPRTAHSATQIIVGRGAVEYRVYVNPQTLQILKVQQEEHRPMRILFHLHGELLMGARGSNIVELAASWTIVLILTGLYLWWPRQTEKLAGVLYIRLREGKRIFWRDLHAVTGIWICAWALFLLFTGLPWAAGWGAISKQSARSPAQPSCGRIGPQAAARSWSSVWRSTATVWLVRQLPTPNTWRTWATLCLGQKPTSLLPG